MGHRTVKRVPLDFDAPLKEIWAGYVMPDEIRPPSCSACGGIGYSPIARWLHDTFYDHNVRAVCGGWNDKLTQADVDALVEAGRLRHWKRRTPTFADSRRGEWVAVPRTADEVNAAQRQRGSLFGECSLDGINVSILVESRCKRLGADLKCPICDGHGMVGTVAEIEAYENWVGTEPPEGEGWQLWETTSEGSPVSPVFATAEALADWCATGATMFADMRATSAEWLASFKAGTTDVDSLLVVRTDGPS